MDEPADKISQHDHPRLAAAMMRLHAAPDAGGVPAERDAQMQAAIHAHFDRVASERQGGRGRRRMGLLPWVAGLGGFGGIAAALLFAIMLNRVNQHSGPTATHSPSSPTQTPALIVAQASADIDASGRVDILDAFALAKAIESQSPASAPSYDINGDGTVDQHDVDAVAAQAVRLTAQTSLNHRESPAGAGMASPGATLIVATLALALAAGLAPAAQRKPIWCAGAMTMALCLGAVSIESPARASFAPASASVSFQAIEIWIDTGDQPLAAWQIEFKPGEAFASRVKIVGIEGGSHAAFANPPYYDPKAMQHERVIIAAYSTAKADGLPSGRTRLATIHVQIEGDAPRDLAADFIATSMALAGVDARPIAAHIELQPATATTAPSPSSPQTGNTP